MPISRIRDLATFVGDPKIRRTVLKVRQAGLETLLDYQRIALLSAAARLTTNIDGDVIEFGSFRGGSAGILLQIMNRDKTLHVFDSFRGMPEVSDEDNFHQRGDFSDTIEETVRNGLKAIGGNFEMHVGYFSETIPPFAASSESKLCLAHIDADLYESIRDALEFCYPRMSKGGVIIFDDYGAPTCEGARKAVDDFFRDKNELVVQLSQPSYGCIVGGGNAFVQLTDQLRFPVNLPFISSAVFGRSRL
jgi:O-methyltransferase